MTPSTLLAVRTALEYVANMLAQPVPRVGGEGEEPLACRLGFVGGARAEHLVLDALNRLKSEGGAR